MASLTLFPFFTASRHLSCTIPQLQPHSNSTLFSRRSISRLLKTLPIKPRSATGVKASMSFSGSFFEDSGDYDYDLNEDGAGVDDEEGFGFGMSAADAAVAAAALEDREEPPCPPGCRRYESMVVIRPDISEEKRLAFIQRYEEILVAGGAMYVEVFNRGVVPLSYSVQKINKDGTKDTYFEGIYLLFTFFTKPESIGVLENQLRMDFSVIRNSTFKVEKKRKLKERGSAKERVSAN